MMKDFNACLRRLLAHIRPRRSRMERKSVTVAHAADGLDYIAIQPGALSMNKWRAR